MDGVTSLRITIEREKAIKFIQKNSFHQKENNFNFEKKKGNNYNCYKKKESQAERTNKEKERDKINGNKSGKFIKNKNYEEARNRDNKEC